MRRQRSRNGSSPLCSSSRSSLALLVPAVAFARAGGGHVGSPGRSSGGSFGGGGSSGRGLGGGVPLPIPIGGGGGGGGGVGSIVVIIIVGRRARRR